MPDQSASPALICVDPDTGYVCITHIFRRYKKGRFIFTNWLSEPGTVRFIAAWESRFNPAFQPPDFEEIIRKSGENAFFVSTTMLLEAGATGLFVRQSRSSLIFVHPDWAIHFANWLSPEFYVNSLAIMRNTMNSLTPHDQPQNTLIHQLFANWKPAT